MTPWAERVSAWVCWLRRPQKVIQAGKAFFAEHQVHTLADLERVVAESGIEIVPLDIDLTTDGAAVVEEDGARYILIKPYLHRLHREFTIAHEVGHHQLHLINQHPSDVQIDSGGIKDVEADCFLILCLGVTIQENLRAQLWAYVRANPNMIRRPFLVLVYLAGYSTRLYLADRLERLFLSPHR
jgi:hypothetical protein